MPLRDYMFDGDPYAERYRLSRQARFYAEQIRERAARVAGREVRSVLDIGCGAGEAALILREVFPEARIVGVDRDQQALDLARRSAEDRGCPCIEYVAGDVEAELPSGPFDLMLASMVLTNTRRPERVLAHAYAALADGGCFWSREAAAPERDENLIYRQRLLHAYLDACRAASPNIDIASRLGAMLGAAGFADVEVERDTYFLGGPLAEGKDLAVSIVHMAYQARPLITGVFGTPDEELEEMYRDAMRALRRLGDDIIGVQHIVNHVAHKKPAG